MTIAEKSTAIGGGADLAQDIINTLTVDVIKDPTDTNFLCYQANGGGNMYVPANEDQRGSSTWCRFDSAKVANGDTHATQTIVDACVAFDGTETLSTVQVQIKAFLNEAEYIERPEENTKTQLV